MASLVGSTPKLPWQNILKEFGRDMAAAGAVNKKAAMEAERAVQTIERLNVAESVIFSAEANIQDITTTIS